MKKTSTFSDTIRWYDQNAQSYASKSFSTDSFLGVKKFGSLCSKGDRILDAGCGDGRYANLLYSQGMHVTGIDLSTKLLEIAQNNYPDVQFIHGDIRDLPFESCLFDAVLAQASLLHFQELAQLKRALSEIHRVLKSHGLFMTSLRSKTSQTQIDKAERHYMYINEGELARLLKDSSFKLIQPIETRLGQSDPTTTWVTAITQKNAD